MNKHLVFVYGTLRRGGAGAMSIRFPDSKFITEAKLSGSLYDLGAYPGLLLDESNSLVTGEVYEVDDETLNKLDDFEASSNYRRKQVEILLGNQRRACCVYEPDPAFYSLRTLITSGDWIEYAGTKTDRPSGTSPDETQSRLVSKVNHMKYYCVAEFEITDPAWVPAYVQNVTKLVEKHGGRYLARTSNIEKLEGERNAPQVVLIIEWPSRDAALAFYNSNEYKPYRENRMAGAMTELLLVAGEDITKTAQPVD
jgi:uncharacterized protein (DUF1330 family)/gamma-glutamylcyclotransferase (GGCT)/AIG2-like uncharacterized protein YtfP